MLSHVRSRRSRRGSALAMTILVVLVLTIVGISVAYFTQVEDKVSGNDKTAKSGFYVSEAGLRYGEKLISNAITSAGGTLTFDALLKMGGTAVTPPGNLNKLTAIPLQIASVTYTNVNVDSSDANKGSFTLYVRNNIEDRSDTPLINDTDNTIDLISVGTVPGGVTKWLEEQLTLKTTLPTNPASQAGGGPGGTNAITQ